MPEITDAFCAGEHDADPNVCAASARVLRVLNDKASIVDLGIGVDETFGELWFQSCAPIGRWRVLQRGRERCRQRLLLPAPAAEPIVQKQSCAQHPFGTQMRLMRQDKLQRFDQMRRDAQQHFAFCERFADQTKFVLLQVAQATVNEFGRPLRRVCSKIVFFDEKDR